MINGEGADIFCGVYVMKSSIQIICDQDGAFTG